MISESGLIKIPKDLLTKTLYEARLIFLSYAYHTTRLDSSVSKYHNIVLKMLGHYNITPIEKHKITGEFSMSYDDSDLPSDYVFSNLAKTIIVSIDNANSNYYGYYVAPNRICICPKKFYAVLSSPEFDDNLLYIALKKIEGTIEHELTHFVQERYLHPENNQMLPGYNKFAHDYYASPTEFQPTLKSDLLQFAALVFQYNIEPKFINETIRYWVGMENIKAPYNIQSRSSFFESLRKIDHKNYIRAVKYFVANVKSTIREYIEEHSKIKELDARRLDSVFCDLRLNEFANLVKIINTFIAFPDTRLHDFLNIKKYLDKIDDKFKTLNDDNKIFMSCGEKAFNIILVQKKSIIIDVIFSNPDIDGTGLMFEFDDTPVYINIHTLTNDISYSKLCDEYDITHMKGNFCIADGSKFKFNYKNCIGTYKNGILQN